MKSVVRIEGTIKTMTWGVRNYREMQLYSINVASHYIYDNDTLLKVYEVLFSFSTLLSKLILYYQALCLSQVVCTPSLINSLLLS